MGAALLQVVVAQALFAVVQGKVWIYGVFSITFLILMAEAFYLSAENFPKTMFLAMTYVQAFLIVAFLAGLLSNWLFRSLVLHPHGSPYIGAFGLRDIF